MPTIENDILKMAQKIQQNESENTVYKKQLDKFFRGQKLYVQVTSVSKKNLHWITGLRN